MRTSPRRKETLAISVRRELQSQLLETQHTHMQCTYMKKVKKKKSKREHNVQRVVPHAMRRVLAFALDGFPAVRLTSPPRGTHTYMCKAPQDTLPSSVFTTRCCVDSFLAYTYLPIS